MNNGKEALMNREDALFAMGQMCAYFAVRVIDGGEVEVELLKKAVQLCGLLDALMVYPRIIRKDELQSIPSGTVVWLDVRNGPGIEPVCINGISEKAWRYPDAPEPVIEYVCGFDPTSDYGKEFVYWTARPSEAQLEERRWPIKE